MMYHHHQFDNDEVEILPHDKVYEIVPLHDEPLPHDEVVPLHDKIPLHHDDRVPTHDKVPLCHDKVVQPHDEQYTIDNFDTNPLPYKGQRPNFYNLHILHNT